MRPEDIWPVEEAYATAYQQHAEWGLQKAQRSSICVVGIARTAMPHIQNTLELVDELVEPFGEKSFYVYENDSEDDTPKVLADFASTRPWMTVESETLRVADERGFQPGRTLRLAAARNRCRAWVEEHCASSTYVLVLDLDPHGGFSPVGILNSIGWMTSFESSELHPLMAGGMASYSLFCQGREDGTVGVAHYDAWAMRLNWWEDRREMPGGMGWAHALLPPVGSPPIPMNSAFGGACLYKTQAYLAGEYSGIGANGQPDCEHVAFHLSLRRKGWQIYLNPGSRYVAILPAQWEESAGKDRECEAIQPPAEAE